MKFFLILILTTYSISMAIAQDTCSRLATINYQQVLVDTNSTQKGEGLRYYLEKDEKAKNYLNLYQEGTKIKLENVLVGTAGTSLILSSFLISSSGNSKDVALIGGLSLIFLNFLIANTYKNENERNLEKSIEEYNKRNLPRIHFSPTSSFFQSGELKPLFAISKTWSF